MNIQIIGTKKSRETQKAERYFNERGQEYQWRDIKKKGLSPGEVKNIFSGIDDLMACIDKKSKAYQKKPLEYFDCDLLEEITENPELLIQPVVRQGRNVTFGYQPEIWKSWFL